VLLSLLLRRGCWRTLAAYSARPDHWLPALDRFKPDMIFVSAGFDAHRDDDMAQLQLDDEDYVWITRQIKAIAGKYLRGRIVSALEGGYELQSLGRCVAAHVRVLAAD